MKDDLPLRELLRATLPEAQVPSRFGADVWQRIQARSEAPAQSGWARFFQPLFALLTRPAFAAVALLLAVCGAAGAATLRAADANEQAHVTLAERHIATLDPFAHLLAAR